MPPRIPIQIPRIPTLIPRIPTLVPRISTLILHIPTLIPRISIIPTLIPRIPIIPHIPFPDSPFRLLQIARLFSFLNQVYLQVFISIIARGGVVWLIFKVQLLF